MTTTPPAVPEAWITDRNILFILVQPFTSPMYDAADKVLEEYSYELRINRTAPLWTWPAIYVNPQIIPTGSWPPSAVSEFPVTDWAKLLWINLEDLPKVIKPELRPEARNQKTANTDST